MQGRIEKRGKSSYRILFDLPRGSDGKRRRKSVTVRGTKRDAQAKLAELQHEINQGVYVDAKRMTVAEYLAKWIEQTRDGKARKTIERYEEIINNHLVPAFGQVVLSKLQPLQVQEYYTTARKEGRLDGKGGLSAKTLRQYHAILHKAFRDAVRWKLLQVNVLDAVDSPKPVKVEMQTLDADQAKKLIEAAQDTRFWVPVVLALCVGLRRGEVLALRWQDLDLDQGVVYVRQSLEDTSAGLYFKEPKTAGSADTLAIGEVARRVLIQHRGQQAQQKLLLGDLYQQTDLVCPLEDGNPWPPDKFSRQFCTFIRSIDGVKSVRYHDLRHTNITLQIERGVHIKVVSARARHATIGITADLYGHVLPPMDRAAADKIDEALGG